MDTRLNTRLPNPQATLSNTYFAPNMPDPVAPQALAQVATPQLVQVAEAGGGESGALNRLFAAFLDAGKKLEATSQIQVASEEQIRVQKLNQEQVRAELKEQAKAAEKQGLMAYGSSPYRKMVAMEYLAERVMRDEFAPTLTQNLSRFSNPMNEEDPKQFARDTFEGLGINGYFAQRAASNMYDSISSNWLAQVTSQRQAKMVRKNKEDLRDASYHVFRNFAANEINYDEVVALINEKSDTYYDLEGDAGREQIVQGLIAAVDAQSMTAEDSDEIDLLQNLINSIRIQKDGALALSTDSLAELDLLENRLNKAEKTVGKMSRDELRDEESTVGDIFNSTVAGDPTLTQEAVWEAMQSRMNELGISAQARDNWFVKSLGDSYAAFKSRDFEMTPAETDAFYGEYNRLEGDLDAQQQFINTADIPEKLRASMNSVLNDRRKEQARQVENVMSSTQGILSGINGQSRLMYENADLVVEPTANLVLSASRSQSAIDAGKNAAATAQRQGLSMEEQEQAAIDAVTSTDKLWSQVTIKGGVDYDVELAQQLAKDHPEIFPPEVLKTMEQISRNRAAGALEEQPYPGLPTDIPEAGLEGRTDVLGLVRPVFDNPDDIQDLYTEAGSDMRRLDRSSINSLTSESRQDAQKYIEEVVAQAGPPTATGTGPLGGMQQSGYEITPEGIVTTFTSAGGVTSTIREEGDTQRLVQAIRISGLSPEDMRDDSIHGLSIDAFPELKNPRLTLMVNPDTFVDDLAELGSIPDGLSLEELQEQYGSNGIITGYLAYREMVGINDAVSFNEGEQNFVAMTLQGIGRYTLPVPDASVIKALDLNSE